ncbi:MAG: anti-sigma factor [Candidatus Eremiobacteraeota bacterium]|nr:anti-sigma factor [Candidatus Eremiobacteraeota bacterium]
MSAQDSHEAMLDDVAVYALGAMSPDGAKRVRDHIATCAECRAEYAALRPAAGALAYSVEACETGENGPHVSALLKPRIMRQVRSSIAVAPARQERARPGFVWPAYLVAAACIAIALFSTISNISINGQLKIAQTELDGIKVASAENARTLDSARTTIADLTSADAKRYPTPQGAIVARGGKIYLAMHDMPTPPKGHVYQAWTLPKGSKTMAPSVTFVPDPHGGAVLALPQDARLTSAVAISVEPDGGSKAPTTKPIAVVTLN